MAGAALGGAGSGAGAGCSRCSSLTFNQDWYKAFGVILCNHCKQEEDLITKASAKGDYLLTDGELRKLGSIEKVNPRHKDWNAMCLFLRSQVEEVSYRKYGDEDGLQAAHHRQIDGRIQARIKRRQDKDNKAAAEAARIERFKRRLEEAEAEEKRSRRCMEDRGVKEVVDEEDARVTRTYEDGTVVEAELI